MIRCKGVFFFALILFAFFAGRPGNAWDLSRWDKGLQNPFNNPKAKKFSGRIQDGKYAGLRVWRGRWRFASNLSPIDEDFMRKVLTSLDRHPPEGTYHGVKDLLHEGEWYSALLPTHVTQVYFVTQFTGLQLPFFARKGLFGHSYLHFQFPKVRPALLISKSGKVYETNDIVISSEAARPEKVKFQPVRGLVPAFGLYFPIVTTFMTAVSEAKRSIRKDRPVQAIRLSLTMVERNSVLREALRFSLNHAYGTLYNYFSPSGQFNCQTAALCMIDEATKETTTIKPVFAPVLRGAGRLPKFGSRERDSAANMAGVTEFFPLFGGQALGCRKLVLDFWNYLELPRIQEELAKVR